MWANIVETDMSAKKYRKTFRHAGQKNGYTPWTVTKAVYAMDKRGNCTEIVFLANNLNEDDSAEIRKHLQTYISKCCKVISMMRLLLNKLGAESTEFIFMYKHFFLSLGMMVSNT